MHPEILSTKQDLDRKTQHYTPEERTAFRISFFREQLLKFGKVLNADQRHTLCKRYQAYIQRIPAKDSPGQTIQLDISAVTELSGYLKSAHQATMPPGYTVIFMLLGMTIGIGLGLAIGAATKHLTIGLMIGISTGMLVGTFIGVSLDKRKSAADKN